MSERKLTLAQTVKAGHRFAKRHVTTHQQPNIEAFWREWEDFTTRNAGKLLDLDFSLILAYTMSALRYDKPPLHQPAGMWDRDLMARLEGSGGLIGIEAENRIETDVAA